MGNIIWDIIKKIGDFLRGKIRQTTLILLFLLFLKYLAPKIGAWLVATLGWNWIFIIVLIIFVILFYLLYTDGGIQTLGPCSLVVYKLRPDQCINVACIGKNCIETRGPYPKWMGSWALLTQATSCVCPTTISMPGLSGIFDKIKEDLDKIGNKEELRKKIIEALGKDLSPEQQNILKEIMEKIQRGEELTPEEYDELKKMA